MAFHDNSCFCPTGTSSGGFQRDHTDSNSNFSLMFVEFNIYLKEVIIDKNLTSLIFMYGALLMFFD